MKQIDPDRLGDVLELFRAEIADREFEPPFHLPIGVLGKTDRAGRGDALEPCGDIDAVAHQVAVGFLDDVAQMDADPEFDATIGRHARVAFDHCVLHLDRAAHRVDHAAKLDEAAVTRALYDSPVMCGDGGIEQIAAKGRQTGQNAVLVGAGKPAVSDDIRGEDRSDLADSWHGASSRATKSNTKTRWSRRVFPGSNQAEGSQPWADGRKAASGRKRPVHLRPLDSTGALR